MPSPVRALLAPVRSLVRRPRTTAFTLALLTLGVGLSTAMFSVLDGVMLRGLPFPEGHRIVQVTTRGELPAPLTPEDFEALSATTGEARSPLEELAGSLALNTVVTRPGVGSKGMTGTYVTPNLFSMLGVEPISGRSFVAEDAEPGGPSVVIVSHRLWHRWFGGDPEALGETVIVNREPMTVIGVMPAGFQFPVRQDAWTPLRRAGWWAEVSVFAVARLEPGVSPEAAERALAPVAARLDETSPLPARSGERAEERRVAVTRYVETLVPPEIDRSLRLMLWAVLGVLLIACGNAAGLRLGDTLARGRELAVRRALGARAGQLLRPLLGEAVVLAGAAAVAGAGLAWLLVQLGSEAMLRGSMLERLFWVDLRLDDRACLFAAAAAALAALLGTLPPALWSLSRRSLRPGAQWGSGSTGRTGGTRLAGLLVVAQVAVCFVLVSASALLVSSGRSVLSREPGFDPGGLMRVMINPYQAGWNAPEEPRAFYARLLPRLAADPAIAGATLASGVPWGGRRGELGVAVRAGRGSGDGTDAASPADLPRARLLRVLPGFFETLELPILAGRAFEPRDLRSPEDVAGAGPDPERVIPVVVSAELAARSLGASRPLGAPMELIELVRSSGDRRPIRGRVIGIAADRFPERGPAPGSTPERAARPGPGGTVYAPLDVANGGGGFLIVRGVRNPERGGGAEGVRSGDLLRRIDRAVAGVDPLVATQDAATYREDMAETVWVERRLAQLFALFAVASLVLSGFGLFGGVVLCLRRRGRELAIRSTLGARPAQLRALLVRQGLVWIGWGLAGGLGLAWLSHRLLRAALHGMEPWDPALTAGAAALTVLALSTGILGPARRAARTDPAAVLDGE